MSASSNNDLLPPDPPAADPPLAVRAKPKPPVTVNKGVVFIGLTIVSVGVLTAFTIAFWPRSDNSTSSASSDDTGKRGSMSNLVRTTLENPGPTEGPLVEGSSPIVTTAAPATPAAPAPKLLTVEEQFALNNKIAHENQMIDEAEKARTSPLVFEKAKNNQAEAPAAAASTAPLSSPTTPYGIPGGATLAGLPGNERSGTGLGPADTFIQNMQTEKLSFLTGAQKPQQTILPEAYLDRPSPYTLSAGTIIPVAAQTAMSSDLPGDILARVTEDVRDSATGRYVLVPHGALLYGRYDSVISYGQQRLLVVGTRLVMPNGRSISLDGMSAVDQSGETGLNDQVNEHTWRILKGALISALISIGGNAAQSNASANYGTTPTIGNNLGVITGQTISQEASTVGQKIVERDLNVQPTLEIRQGFQFNILVNKDMILAPYRD